MEITEFNGELFKDFIEIVHRTMKEIHNHPEYNLSKNNYNLLSHEGKYADKVFSIYSKITVV